MHRRLLAAGASVAVLAATIGISTSAASTGRRSSPAASSGPIQVLSIGDVSGPTKIYGELHYAGILAAAAYLNSHGGVLGRKIVVTHVDSGGVTANAVSGAIKALSGSPGKYAFVDAGAEGTEDDALIPIMKKYHQFAITLDDTSVCATVSNCPTEFVVKGNPQDPSVAAAAFFKSKGLKKVGVLEEAIAYTEGETPGIVKSLKADGITPTVVSFPATATDVTPEMSQLKSDGVQGVFAEALGPPAGYALTARAGLSWNSAPIVFDVAASSLDITKLAPAADVANAYTNIYHCQDAAAKQSEGFTLLNKYLPSTYKMTADSQACDIPGNGWDGLIEFALAAKAAGSLTTAALTKEMVSWPAMDQDSPLYITSKVKMYTTKDHDDAGEKPSDFVVVPVGPVSGMQDHPL